MVLAPSNIKTAFQEALKEFRGVKAAQTQEQRYARFRKLGWILA